jgi:hypothetical protein
VLPDEPEGRRKLWLKVQRERDPKKLVALIDQLNQLLSEEEKRVAAEEAGQEPADSRSARH